MKKNHGRQEQVKGPERRPPNRSVECCRLDTEQGGSRREGEGTSQRVAPAKPPRPKRRRGRRPSPLKAPPGAMRRFTEELFGAPVLAVQQARASEKPAPDATLAQLSFEDDETSAEVFTDVPMTEAQRKQRRSQERKQRRDDEARHGAELLALVVEQQAWRVAQEKAAADRKERGVKLTYEEWKQALLGR